MIMVLQQIKAEIQRRKKVVSDACGGVIVSNSNHVEYKTLCELEEYINTNFDETCDKIERYNPFKASIESIADMCYRYGEFGDDRANDFANNIKVKCKDAMEYDSIYKEDHIVDINEMVDMQWLTPQLDKSYAAYGERKMMELTRFDGYAMLDAIAFGRKQATIEFENNRVNAFKNQTEAEAQIEMDFAVSIIEKEHRTPTFDDAIKYGMRLQQMKDNQDESDMALIAALDGAERGRKAMKAQMLKELPKWRYKKDNAPLIRDSIILNKYGCVAKSPSGAIVSDVWVIDYDELAKLPKEEQQ